MVVINGKTIMVLSVNCQGLQTLAKRIDVINYLKDKNPDIVCLQDTHWIPEDMAEIKKTLGWGVYIAWNENKFAWGSNSFRQKF